MALLNLVLWGAGVALIVIGYTRARGPLARYNALKEQDANVARYEAWRGGARASGRHGRIGRDADPASPGPDRDRGGRRRVRADLLGLPRPIALAAQAGPEVRRRGLACRRTGASSIAVQRSITTTSPASAAIVAAFQLTMPSCSQKQAGPDRDGLMRVGHDLRAAEDIDDVERPGGGRGLLERRVRRDTVDRRTHSGSPARSRSRSRRSVTEHPLRRPARPRRGPDDRDAAGRVEDAAITASSAVGTGPRPSSRSRNAMSGRDQSGSPQLAPSLHVRLAGRGRRDAAADDAPPAR